MIECNSCKARVSLKMKHSIKNNECPYCGSNLIGNQSLKICKSISNDLLNAGFNNKIFELSLFIFKNYFDNNIEKESESLQSVVATQADSSTEEEKENSFEEKENSFEEKENSFEEKEFFSEQEYDEDDDDRVSRLRQLAKNNPILNKKGTVVRRVTT